MTLALVVLAAFLLGGPSLSVWWVRARLGRDVRELGSGNPGATNVLGVLGPGPACAVLITDVAKGALAVAGARLLGVAGSALGVVAFAVVVGHVYPLVHGLRGGKGVATALGAFAGLAPTAVAVSLLVFLVALAVSRYVAVGSVLGAGALPLAVLALDAGGRAGGDPRSLALWAGAAAALVAARHRENARRILAGTEPRAGAPRRRREAR